MPLLKIGKRLTFIHSILQFFLYELQPSKVLFNYFSPCPDTYGNTFTFLNEPTVSIWPIVDPSFNLLIVFVRDQPKMPPQTVHAIESRISLNGESITLDLRKMLSLELHLWRFQLDH